MSIPANQTLEGNGQSLRFVAVPRLIVRRHDMNRLSEQRLVKSAFALAVAAVLIGMLPPALFMISLSSEYQGPGSMGLSDALGYMILSLIAVTWLGSFVLLLFNAVCNRPALRSRFGIAAIVLNLLILLNALFWALVVGNDLIG
jgi:hypothetical protein